MTVGDTYMTTRRKYLAAVLAGSIIIATLGLYRAHAQSSGSQAALPAQVDGARLLAADNDPGNWMSYSRTYSEQRFSPLVQINAGNAGNLKLPWYYDLDTSRGQEATPLVIDGVM